jgi:AcrR family transcriptional regulator
MGRPRAFDEDAVLETAMRVFWEKGYEGTSMSDLVTATGLLKGSLYAAFGDKRSLYRRALAHYDRTLVAAGVAILRGSGSAYERIERFLQSPIDAVARKNDRRGCFLCNAAIDQAVTDPEIGQEVNASINRLEQALHRVLAEGRMGSNGVTDRARARHLLAVYLGLRVLARAGQPIETLNDVKQSALATAFACFCLNAWRGN